MMSVVMFGLRLTRRMARTEKMKHYVIVAKASLCLDRRYVMNIRKFVDEMSKREILTKTRSYTVEWSSLRPEVRVAPFVAFLCVRAQVSPVRCLTLLGGAAA